MLSFPIFDGWSERLVGGALMTILISSMSMMIGLGIGVAAAMASRSSSAIVRVVASIYANVFRGVPELLVVLLFFFGSSTATNAIASAFGYLGYVDISNVFVGTLAMSTIAGAYATHIVRAALAAVPTGQSEAAAAFGMTTWSTLVHVRMPQVARLMIPDLGNLWNALLKDSAVVSVVGLVELSRVASLASEATQKPFQIYLAAAAIYLLITMVSTKLFHDLEARYAW